MHLFRFLLIISLFPAVSCMAQADKKAAPITVTLGRIHASEIKGGKMIPTTTTRQEIFKNALLLPDINNCRVNSYKFSMIAPGQPYYGPLYINGADLTDEIREHIKQQDGPGVKIYIEDIQITHRDVDATARPIYLTYDH